MLCWVLSSFLCMECISRRVLWVEKPGDLFNHGWFNILQAGALALTSQLQKVLFPLPLPSSPLQLYLGPTGLGLSDYMLA